MAGANDKKKLFYLLGGVFLFLIIMFLLVMFNIDITYILFGLTILSLAGFPFIFLGKELFKKSNNFEKKYEEVLKKVVEDKKEAKAKLEKVKKEVENNNKKFNQNIKVEDDEDVKYYQKKYDDVIEKEKKIKKKHKEDTKRIKFIIKKEEEVIKEMGKTNIPSFDEQFATNNKTGMLKMIGIIIGIILFLIWSILSVVVYNSYTNKLTDKNLILKNSVIEINGQKFTGDMFIQFDDKLSNYKEEINKYPTDENIENFKTKLEYHIDNSSFKVFNSSFEDKDMKWVKGLDEAVKIQEKFNQRYIERLNNFHSKLITMENNPNLSKKDRKKLNAMFEKYNNEQTLYNNLEEYRQGLAILKGGYEELLSEYIESKDNKEFIENFIIWWFTISVWLLYGIGFVAKMFINKKKQLTTHGSAKWASIENLLLGKDSQKPFATDLLVPKGVVLGKYNGHILRDNSKTHILVAAPTRTGKGVSLIIPTLIDSWNESVFVLDIKGENYQLTSGFRKERFNNKIIRFAPMSTESCKYNPMNEIDVAFEGGLKENEQINDIATLLSQSEKPDPFWDENGSIFIQGLMTFAIYNVRQEGINYKKKILSENRPLTDAETLKATRRAGFSDINDVLVNPDNSMELKDYLSFLAGLTPNKNKNGKALFGVPAVKIIEGEDGKKKFEDATDDNFIKHFDPNDLENNAKLMEVLTNSYPTNTNIISKGIHPNIQKLFSKICTMSENMFGSVKAVGETKLKMFSTPIVRYNTSSSDFRIWDLMNYKQPISLYLVIEPKDLVTMSPLARIVLIQIVSILTPEMDYISGQAHKWRMLFVLDEFPALGKMEILDTAIGYVAGYGMKLMIILQSLDQLFKIYGDKNGFMSNCAVQVFYTANENQTGKYVSETFGNETIEYENKSGMKGFNSGTKSESRQSRNLLSVNEMRNFPSDKILLSVSGKPPILTEKIQYFKVPEYKGRTKMPYIISEGLDKIADNKNIENDLSYKLVKPSNDDILNRYEVFYEPRNDIYGVESTFSRYFKVCYSLGYVKQPLIFARYENVAFEENKTEIVAKGFIGDLLNNFDFKGENKDIVLSRSRTELIKKKEDILEGINKFNKKDMETYYKESILGEGRFMDKKYKSATGKTLEHLFDLDNMKLINDLPLLNDIIIKNNKNEEFSNEFLPINSTLILDLEETDKDRAEIVYYGALLYDGLLETILSVNNSKAITEEENNNDNGNKSDDFNKILSSYDELINFLKTNIERERENNSNNTKFKNTSNEIENLENIDLEKTKTEFYSNWYEYFKKHFKSKNLFVDVNKDGKNNSLQEIYERRKKNFFNLLINNEDLTYSLTKGKSKLFVKVDGEYAESKDNKVLNQFNITYNEIKKLWIKYTHKMNDDELENSSFEDFYNIVAKELTDKTYVMLLSQFEIIDPQTERIIKHQIYVPIQMKVIDLGENNINLDKQKQANIILRNLIHYLRNNNATWNALQKDVRSSLVVWENSKNDTQLRKLMLDNVG